MRFDGRGRANNTKASVRACGTRRIAEFPPDVLTDPN